MTTSWDVWKLYLKDTVFELRIFIKGFLGIVRDIKMMKCLQNCNISEWLFHGVGGSSVADSVSLLTLFHVCSELIDTLRFIVIQNTRIFFGMLLDNNAVV